MKKLILVLLTFAVSVSLLSCCKSNTNTEEKTSDTFQAQTNEIADTTSNETQAVTQESETTAEVTQEPKITEPETTEPETTVVQAQETTTTETEPVTEETTNTEDPDPVPQPKDNSWFELKDNCFESKQFGVGLKLNPEWILSENDMYPVSVKEKSDDINQIIQIRRIEQGKLALSSYEGITEMVFGGLNYKFTKKDNIVRLARYDEATGNLLVIEIQEYIYVNIKDNFYKV